MLKQEKQNHWLNKNQIARSIGISARAFSDWNIKPVAKIGRETFYLMSDVLSNRLEHQAENLKPVYEDLEKERIRLTRAQAENLELKNEVARSEVAPIELLTHAISNGATQIAAILGSIPLNIKRQIPRLTATEIDTVRREIVKAQNAAAHIKINFDDYENE